MIKRKIFGYALLFTLIGISQLAWATDADADATDTMVRITLHVTPAEPMPYMANLLVILM